MTWLLVGWKAKAWLSGWIAEPMLVTVQLPLADLTHLYSSTPETYTMSGVVGSTLTSLVNAPYTSIVELLVQSSQSVPTAVVVRYKPRKASELLAMRAERRAGLLAG